MSELLKPEPDATVKPRRAERVPIVADMHVEYPFASGDHCRLCPSPLSRYNPHVVCFHCIERARADGAFYRDSHMRDLMQEKRLRNRKCPRIDKSRLNIALIERTTSSGARIGGHRPQHGHN